MTSADNQHNGAAKWMLILAWVSAFALLIYVFSDLLEKQINPNSQPDSVLQGSQITVNLVQNKQGHYVVTGAINDIPVVFLVDTGATDVAVPASLAGELGLTRGRAGLANTANGTVTVYQTEINKLSIGQITLYNVDANINPGMQSGHVLLGMSALKQLEFTQRGNTLILRTLN